MDQTVTSAGARDFWRTISASPERDLVEIHRRQSCVGEFAQAPSAVEEVSSILKSGSDLERILGRLRNRLVRPRELGGLRSTIRGLPGVSRCFAGHWGNAFRPFLKSHNEFKLLRNYAPC